MNKIERFLNNITGFINDYLDTFLFVCMILFVLLMFIISKSLP